MRSSILLIFTIFTLFFAYSYGAAHSNEVCINACSNTFSPTNLMICNQCAIDPPYDFAMCKYSCGNTILPQNTQICNKCVLNMPLTSEWCTHACANTLFTQLSQVCTRCR